MIQIVTYLVGPHGRVPLSRVGRREVTGWQQAAQNAADRLAKAVGGVAAPGPSVPPYLRGKGQGAQTVWTWSSTAVSAPGGAQLAVAVESVQPPG